ncbi:Dna2/Cas4 domain-containing protein [Methanolobus sediminis]|uniref:Dna2/Cas4 domain-containing protein n=1 Tax=Methanolobus sediminis TaxID=3072978 RepID=A0AA51UMF0_9EURY|nr:Dna2/Cas4 domain-containing protein [Methanolobus sediminis]WMW26317.1 Dna2/Cas4 domain-containing protein [Methanolobus sediminis]
MSELSMYFSCARKLYYSCRGHEQFHSSSLSYIEHLVLKEMAMTYSDMLKSSSSKDDVLSVDFDSLLLQTMDDLSIIYPDEMAGVTAEEISELAETVRSYLAEIQQNLTEQIEDTEISEISIIADLISSSDNEPYLHSEKLNVTGVPYRLLNMNDSFVPVMIKTSKAPENGVWNNDRLHITSLAMLAEETHGIPVKSGLVIYAKSGHFRKANIHSNDRRQVLKAISRARQIKDGKMPDKNESALCSSCEFSEMCNVKASLASKFF